MPQKQKDDKTAAPKAVPKDQEVTLKTGHTHAGMPCQAGDKIKVTTAQKDWLIANGVVEATAAKQESK